MSLFWGRFKSRDKTHHCIHEHQSTQPEEPIEEPILETTTQLPTYVGAAEVNASGVEALPIARDSKGRCQLCRQEQLAARGYRIRLITGASQFPEHSRPVHCLGEVGIFFPFALQALDTTIVASALSRVASDFGEYLPISTDMPIDCTRRTKTDELHHLDVQSVFCYIYPLLGSDY
jgi:hypothetical protein